MNLAHVQLDLPNGIKYELKSDMISLTPDRDKFNPIPITQNQLVWENTWESSELPHIRPDYTFGAEHLRIYKRSQKENKYKPSHATLKKV